MSYGFKKAQSDGPSIVDLTNLPSNALPVDGDREEAAVSRGEALGFTDRGQSTQRRKRKAAPTASLYVKGPKELIDWFIDYTNEHGHAAYWRSLEDFRTIIQGGDV